MIGQNTSDPNTIAAALHRFARTSGDHVAVDDGDRQLTYGSLADRAARLAREIDALASRGQPVGLMLPVGIDYIVAIVAAMVSGRPYVALDPSFPALQHARIAEYAGLEAILVDAAGAAIVADSLPALKPIAIPLDWTVEGAAELPLTTRASDPAFIYFTSGSTGRPKGVLYEQGALIEEIRSYIAALSIGPADRISMLYRPSASAGSRDIFAALVSGARLCIVDLKRHGANEARRHLIRHGITIYHSAPPVLRTILGDASQPIDRIATARVVHLIGDRIVPGDLDLVRDRFEASCRLYIDVATTETFSYASWLVDPALAVVDDLVAVGRPRSPKGLRLIDEDGRIVLAGTAGEIVVTTRTSARGYWRDDENTRLRFQPSQTVPGATDYRTGDIGRFRSNGLLDLLGRKDRQIKIGGNTVHPGEVESIIAALPGVAAVGVVARVREVDARLIAYYAGEIAPDTIRAWCVDRLPAHLCPAEAVPVTELPTLGTGKIDYAALEKLDQERSVTEIARAWQPTAPVLPLTGIVRNAWEQFLPGTFDLDQSFGDAGGDSLKALNLFALLEERLGRSLPVTLMTRMLTPSDLIIALKAELAPVRSARESQIKPALFLVPGLYGEGADLASSDLASALSADFDVQIVDYRIAGNEFRGDFRPERLYADVVGRIVQASAAVGAVWLVGLSYGGKLAAEVALQATAQGARIERLINIDGATAPNVKAIRQKPGVAERVRAGVMDSGGIAAYVSRVIVARGVRRLAGWRRPTAVRLYLALLARFGPHQLAQRGRREAMGILRRRAFGRIPVTSLPVPMVLIRSDDDRFDLVNHPDLGWARYCNMVEIRSIGGDHRQALEGTSRLAAEICSLKLLK